MVFFSNDLNKPVIIKRRKGAKRVTLRVCRLSGEIFMTIPLRTSISSAEQFLVGNVNWINDQLKNVIPRSNVSVGTNLPIDGVERQILLRNISPSGNYLEPRALYLNCLESDVGTETRKFLLEYFSEEIIPIIVESSKHIGREIKSIRFKDTKSRWGSCSSDGNLMINWRLVMAPPSIYRYVALHEVSHLKHMNHGPEFWKLVQSLHPSYRQDRCWLKKNGWNLRRFVFDPST